MSDKVALVTGGAGGIGTAICRRLAADGCAVAVADLDDEATAAVAATVGGAAVRVDVTDPVSVSLAVATARDLLGPVSICVNCAGWERLKPFLSTDEAFTERILAINLAGPIRMTRAV